MKLRIRSVLLSVVMIMTMTAVMIPASGYLYGSATGSYESYAAAQPVTFGILESNNTVTPVNSIDLGTFDLSCVDPGDEQTYTISKEVCIKGAKNSGLILVGSAVNGNEDLGSGGFYSGNIQTNIDNGIPYLKADVSFNAREMKAGTYNGFLEMSVRKEASGGNYVPADISANSGAIVSHDSILSIPVTITLYGMNSALTGKISGLRATAGNDMITLTWNSSDDDSSFTVYRREGTETATPDNYDLSKYIQLSEDPVYEKTYRDNAARNGKAYSYFVIAGDDLDHSYPSNAVTATPSAGKVKEPLPPILSYPDNDPGTVTLDWSLTEDSKTELDNIDHFNVYKNGKIIAQVDKNAYKESVEQIWDDEKDKTVDYHSYKWTLTLDSEPGVVFKWWVTAVSKDGVEGSASEKHDEAAESTEPEIGGCNAWYTQYHWDEDGTSSKPAMLIKIQGGSIYGADYIKLWRRTGTQDYRYIGKIKYNSDIGNGEYDYADKDVTEGSKYTYRAIVIDDKKKESAPFEFSVTASENSGNVFVTTLYYSIDENNDPCFDFWGEQGYTYRLFRNGSEIKRWNGNYEDISYSDKLSGQQDGTYTYYLTTSSSGTATSTGTFEYVKDSSNHTLEKKPGAPSLRARVTGLNKDKIVLRWSRSAEGGEADGYYIYKEINKPVYDENGNFTGRYERGLDTEKFSDSDDYISNWWMSEYPQNRYIRLRADKNSFTDTIDWGYEEQFEVKYWVCAYNQYGESEVETEQIAVFEYNNGSPASNGDTTAPGKPFIKQVWVEPTEKYEKYRNCYVTWEDPVKGGVDQYRVILQKKTGNSWTEKNSCDVDTGKMRRAMFSLDNTQPDDRGTYRFVVWAKNRVNYDKDLAEDSNNYAVSDEFLISSLPKLSLSASLTNDGGYYVDLSWDDTNYKSSARASTYKIYRREEYGIWKLISEGGAGISGSEGIFAYRDDDNSLETGATYYYRIESGADNKTRLSDVRSIHLSSSSLLPGRPSGLTAVRIDNYDRYMFTWNAPESGGRPLKYVIEYYEDDEWHDSDEVVGTSTTLTGIFTAGYRIRIHAENDAGRGDPSEEYYLGETAGREDSYWPHSIRPSVTASSEEDDAPWVKLSWSKDETENWGQAIYYALYKYDGSSYAEQLVANIPVRTNQNDYEWTDTDVESGGLYEYYLRPTNSWGYDYVNDYSVWAIPESTKKTSSQITVEKTAALIDSIDTPVDTEDAAVANQITQASEIFESLTEEQKKDVDAVDPPSPRVKKLKEAVDAVKSAKAMIDYSDGNGQYITKPVQDKIDGACSAVISKYGSISAIDTSIFGNDDEHKTLYRNIKSARSAYEALSDDAKRTVNTAQLVQIETKINSLRQQESDSSAALNVFTKLNDLPGVDEYNDATGKAQTDIEDLTDAARRSYDALLSSQKAQLEAMDGYTAAFAKLTALETAISQRGMSDEEREAAEQQEQKDKEEAEAVDRQIEALGTIELSKKGAVKSARRNYNALSSNAQSKVTKLQLLIAAENRIAELEKQAADIGAAEPVAAMIDALPPVDRVALKDESDVLTAQIAFDNLTDEQKALVDTADPVPGAGVSRTDKLNGLIDEISRLREAEDRRLANAVSELIERLPDTEDITVETITQYEPAVRDARNEYNKLTQNQKRYVTTANVNRLTAVENAIDAIRDPVAAMEVQNLINALPDADKLALCDEARLNNATDRYYALTDKQKTLIDADSVIKLGDLQNRMAKLKADKAEADRRAAEEEAKRKAAAAPTEIRDLPAVKISKPQAGRKKVTVKWKKPSKKALKKIQGIEIHVVGTDKDITTTAGKKKTSKKVGGLTSKQKYTVQVRAYANIGGVKHVSAWKSKTVKVK